MPAIREEDSLWLTRCTGGSSCDTSYNLYLHLIFISKLKDWRSHSIYSGITGTDTAIDKNTLAFLKSVGEGGSKIYGGFGISNGQQSKALADYVEAIVAGSVFVRLITENQNDEDALYKAVRAKAKELTGR